MPPLNHFHFSRICKKCHRINNNHSLEENSYRLFVFYRNKIHKCTFIYERERCR